MDPKAIERNHRDRIYETLAGDVKKLRGEVQELKAENEALKDAIVVLAVRLAESGLI